MRNWSKCNLYQLTLDWSLIFQSYLKITKLSQTPNVQSSLSFSATCQLSRNICIRRHITEAATVALGGVAEICCFDQQRQCLNRNVFNCRRLNVYSVMSDKRSEAGSQFHVVGPLTAKLHWPIVVLVRETSGIPDDAGRRCWRPWADATGTQRFNQVAMSCIVDAFPHQYRITAVLKMILFRTGNQWRVSRTRVMWS